MVLLFFSEVNVSPPDSTLQNELRTKSDLFLEMGDGAGKCDVINKELAAKYEKHKDE